MTVLEVKDLHVSFRSDDGEFEAVRGISFQVLQGETLGIVGESGCGKSVTALSIMGLLPKGIGRLSQGQIVFEHQDLTVMSEKEQRKLQGYKMAMVFQEPMTSLNPVFDVGEQIGEQIRLHLGFKKEQARQKTIDMLRLVGIPRAENIIREYPHQLSGGMRQRVMIAMAMSCDPNLLIADEPTTALDVTIQAQILDLMRKLKVRHNTSIMLITHDLGVVAEMCNRVIVMYSGQVVEESPVRELFHNPKHPYTKGLLASIPSLHEQKDRLSSIKGSVPHPLARVQGCRFAPRCNQAHLTCQQMPPLFKITDNHSCRCWLLEGGAKDG